MIDSLSLVFVMLYTSGTVGRVETEGHATKFFAKKDSQWSEDITTTTDVDEELEATVGLR